MYPPPPMLIRALVIWDETSEARNSAAWAISVFISSQVDVDDVFIKKGVEK